MSVNLKQMDAYVSGSTVVFDESSQAVPTKDLASVDSETSPDTILGVKSGVVAQFALSDVLPGLKIVKKGGNGYLASNSTLNFALVGNSTNGVKVAMLMFGSSDNTMQVVLLNTTTSATSFAFLFIFYTFNNHKHYDKNACQYYNYINRLHITYPYLKDVFY